MTDSHSGGDRERERETNCVVSHDTTYGHAETHTHTHTYTHPYLLIDFILFVYLVSIIFKN